MGPERGWWPEPPEGVGEGWGRILKKEQVLQKERTIQAWGTVGADQRVQSMEAKQEKECPGRREWGGEQGRLERGRFHGPLVKRPDSSCR